MSSFKVEVVEIASVTKHPNADKLDIVTFTGKDWQCVTSKDSFKQNDLAVYFPIDSLLPPEIETKIFGIDSKVKLNNSRVRTIKLRGAISQGLVVNFNTVGYDFVFDNTAIGTDLTRRFGVTKYEPPVKVDTSLKGSTSKKQVNSNFRKYTGIENAKNYNNIFTTEDIVVVTEKIHGSSFRAGYVPTEANTLWKKVKKFFNILPKYEFVYGSHNVQLQDKLLYKGFYDKNIYAEAVIKYNLKEILKPNEVVYGEIYGEGVQKNYSYGLKDRALILFDVMIAGEYLDAIEGKKWVEARQLPYVPVLYTGPFDKDKILALRDGDSVLNNKQKVREGVVVKPVQESTCYVGRKMLKYISDQYLLKNQDEESLAH